MNKHPRTAAAGLAAGLLVLVGAAALAVPVVPAGEAPARPDAGAAADAFFTPHGPASLQPLVCERPARETRGVGSGSLVWVAAVPAALSA